MNRPRGPRYGPAIADRRRAASGNLRSCTLCARRCGVDRIAGEEGFCRTPVSGHVFHHYRSFSEEEEISPTYEILFAGCSQRCVFCSVRPHVENPLLGRPATVDGIRSGIAVAARQGLRTVTFVGGEPTVSLHAILSLLEGLETDLPIVWKTNGYLSVESESLLAGLVDVHVADMHFGNDACALALAAVADGFSAVAASLLRVAPVTRVILRHLLLPGHLECCALPVVRWAAARLPGVPLHLLDTFTPWDGARVDRARLCADRRAAQRLALDLGVVTVE